MPGNALPVDSDTGLVHGARQLPSPNADDRPPGAVPDLIVVHGISLPPGEFGGPWIDALFTNTLDPGAHPAFKALGTLRVSAHLLVRRDGAVVQYVALGRRAWHAGVSNFCGRTQCNDFSIGIELEGCDDRPYEPGQYRVLGQLVQSLRAFAPSLAAAPVVGHADIAPGRKTDPGPSFDWGALARAIEQARP